MLLKSRIIDSSRSPRILRSLLAMLVLALHTAAFSQSLSPVAKTPLRTGSAAAAVSPMPVGSSAPLASPSTPVATAVASASGPLVAFGPVPTLKPGLPPPHSFAAANVYHAKALAEIAAGDKTSATANFQAEVNALNNGLKSSIYKNSPYGPLLMYRIAHVESDFLNDPNSAMTQYNTLLSTYQVVSYPDRKAVVIERQAISHAADLHNQKESFLGIHPYYIMDFFVGLTGRQNYSYGIALLLISVVIRLVLTPLTLKQYRGMAEMQRLQPLVKEINKKYEKDAAVKNQKMMELYKEHNVNPLGGCLPTLLQLPIYYAMYHMVWLYQYHFYHGTFLWIGTSLAARFPGIIAPNLMEPDYALLLLYCISMYVTQRMMPASDPSQAEVQKTTALMTSVFFFYIFQSYHFASAFVLYWLISNILSTMTQMYFMHKGLYPRGGSQGAQDDGPGSGPGRGPLKTTPSPSGAAAFLEAPAGGEARKPYAAKPGTAKGTISPKVYPKKKRR